VLNAFRHHRGGHFWTFERKPIICLCSTPFGITEVGIPPMPLNRSSTLMCSTPFGITEVGIPLPLPPWLVVEVLNAFRHHRGGHPPRQNVDRARRAECSTPFGITEVGISESAISCRVAVKCSTPFGITEVGIGPR